MRKLILLLVICLLVILGCSTGNEIVGVYSYSPNPDTIVTSPFDGATGIEVYQVDLTVVGDGIYRHIINTSVDADGSLYNYSEYVAFSWAADIRDGKQEIAAFDDGEGHTKRITFDPNVPNALVDENGIIYPYIKN